MPLAQQVKKIALGAMATSTMTVMGLATWMLWPVWQGHRFAQALSRNDARAMLDVAERLRRYGPRASSATPSLICALGHADYRVRNAALETLWAIGPSAAPDLIHALESDGDTKVRQCAARAIERIGPAAPQAVPVLAELLEVPVADLRECAAYALVAIGPPAEPHLDKILAVFREIAARERQETPAHDRALVALGEMGVTAMPVLLDALRSSDYLTRHIAIWSLARIGQAALPESIRLLKDEDPAMRSAAVQILQRMGPDAIAAAGDSYLEVVRSWPRID